MKPQKMFVFALIHITNHSLKDGFCYQLLYAKFDC